VGRSLAELVRDGANLSPGSSRPRTSRAALFLESFSPAPFTVATSLVTASTHSPSRSLRQARYDLDRGSILPLGDAS